VLAAGATDLRLYHAGLASAADHTAMCEVANATVPRRPGWQRYSKLLAVILANLA
jgi:hypothetical protein